MATTRRHSSVMLRTYRVLLVEDDITACRTLSTQLVESAGGMTFQFAHTLADALMLISRRKFDVILLDLMLPDSRGLETFVEVHLKAPQLPILILSAASEAQAMKAVQQGAQDFIDKDVHDVRLLERMIRYAVERTAAQRERETAERRFTEMQTLKIQGLMAAGVAHDFNNLLAAVIGRLQLLQIKRPDPQLFDQLEEIITTAYRASELARQMMACTGQGQTGSALFDINKLINEMTALIQSSIGKKIEFQRELSQTLPFVKCDPTNIRQVIMNLILNSAQAIGDATGIITIRSGAVQADARYLKDYFHCDNLPGAYVYLDIIDTGCGMDADTQTRIFEPFFTTKFTGHGLGMSAVLGAVRQHKGAIRIRSTPGVGTAFTVIFPAQEPPPPRISNIRARDSKKRESSRVAVG